MAAALAASLYWVALGLSIMFHGTAFFDPEFDDPSRFLLGLPINLFVAIVALLVVALATWLGFTRVRRGLLQVSREVKLRK